MDHLLPVYASQMAVYYADAHHLHTIYTSQLGVYYNRSESLTRYIHQEGECMCEQNDEL